MAAKKETEAATPTVDELLAQVEMLESELAQLRKNLAGRDETIRKLAVKSDAVDDIAVDILEIQEIESDRMKADTEELGLRQSIKHARETGKPTEELERAHAMAVRGQALFVRKDKLRRRQMMKKHAALYGTRKPTPELRKRLAERMKQGDTDV